jgi:hypothetical protein
MFPHFRFRRLYVFVRIKSSLSLSEVLKINCIELIKLLIYYESHIYIYIFQLINVLLIVIMAPRCYSLHKQ